MIIKQINNGIKNDDGMTLIETVTGLFLLVIVILSMYTVFLSAQRIIVRGSELEKDSQSAYSELELENSDTALGSVSLLLGGQPITFDGHYIATGSATGSNLHAFVIKDPIGYLGNVLQEFIMLRDKMALYLPDVRVTLGLPKNMDNSSCRDYLKKEKYHGTWPIFPNELLTANGLTVPSGTVLYVQPFVYNGSTYPNADTYLYANSFNGSNNWTSYLIYDHEEKAWYCKKNMRSITFIGTWASVKTKIHGSDWKKLTY